VSASRAGRSFAPPKLVLHEEATVAGIVVDEAGKPVAGARVAKDVVSTYLAAGALPAGVVTTARDGRFTLGQLPAGDVTLEALAPDVGRGSVAVHLDGGRTTRDVKIVIARGDDDSARERAAGGVAVTLGETSEPREVVIVAVAESSEAERAGLVPNDVVVEVDGQAVSTMKDARQRLSGPLADEAVLKIRRGENTLVFRVPRESVRK
jgi:membrane-associated protease RseP (regulator of RpoE activity)